MSNGSEACCALGICCDALSAKQIDTVAKALTEDTGIDIDTAKRCVDWWLGKYDVAMKGTLQPLIDSVVTLQKHHGHKT